MDSPLSIRERAANIIEIYLFINFADFALAGHKSVSNLSSSLRFIKFGLIDDIIPNKQFLFVAKVGHFRQK